MSTDLIEIDGGKPRVFFHAGQKRVWESERRIILMLAGTQSGKTSFGPHWLLREIRRGGQGDYLVVAPSFPLLDLKAIPAFCWLFESMLHLGTFTTGPSRKFTFSEAGERRLFGSTYDPNRDHTRVIFGYATEPDSLVRDRHGRLARRGGAKAFQGRQLRSDSAPLVTQPRAHPRDHVALYEQLGAHAVRSLEERRPVH